jgi:hypothetical protein
MPHVDTPQSRVFAGMARGDITPPVGIYHRMWGAATHDKATGVHRPLTATALWLEPAGGSATDQARLLVGLDHCILDHSEVQNIRQAASAASGIAPENVHVALSHTHGAGFMARSRANFPGGDLIGPYLDVVAEEVALLAVEAKEHRTPSAIVFGTGRCSLAAHRDFHDEVAGHFVCGFNPSGPADDTLTVARIVGEGGKTLGTLVNYACHPTTLAWDNTAISPDWVGAMREVVENATGGPCLFLQGASGDLGPREGYVGDHSLADRNGRQVAYAAMATLEALPQPGTRYEYAGPVLSGCWIGTWKHVPASDARASSVWHWEEMTVELPYRADLPTMEQTLANREQWQHKESEARSGGDEKLARTCRANVEQMTRQIGRLETLPPGRNYPLRLTVGRVGDALWVLAPGELYHVFQTSLRQQLAPRTVIVSTVTDDWQPGYLPAAGSYGKGIYQDIISPLAAGCLETLLSAVARRLSELASL